MRAWGESVVNLAETFRFRRTCTALGHAKTRAGGTDDPAPPRGRHHTRSLTDITQRGGWRATALVRLSLMPVLLAACTDSALLTSPSDMRAGSLPNPQLSNLSVTATGDTTVFWVNNVLEFVSEHGEAIRLVRDQQDAQWVSVYENDVFTGRVDLQWNVDTVTHLRYEDAHSSYWYVATADSVSEVISTGAGGGGGGGCPPEGCIYIESVPDDTCGAQSAEAAGSDFVLQSDCSAERSAAAAASGGAVAYGLIGVATAKFAGVNIITARRAAIATAGAFGAGFAYVVCLLQ